MKNSKNSLILVVDAVNTSDFLGINSNPDDRFFPRKAIVVNHLHICYIYVNKLKILAACREEPSIH